MSTPTRHRDTRTLQAIRRSSRRSAGLDLRVPAGSIYGYLGRNGAGKTTTIKTLMGLIRPTAGEGSRVRLPR